MYATSRVTKKKKLNLNRDYISCILLLLWLTRSNKSCIATTQGGKKQCHCGGLIFDAYNLDVTDRYVSKSKFSIFSLKGLWLD